MYRLGVALSWFQPITLQKCRCEIDTVETLECDWLNPTKVTLYT